MIHKRIKSISIGDEEILILEKMKKRDVDFSFSGWICYKMHEWEWEKDREKEKTGK